MTKSKLIVPSMPVDMREHAKRYGLNIPPEMLPAVRDYNRRREAAEAAEPEPKPHRAPKAVRSKRRATRAARKANR